ncbi:MAG: hypothetical protein KDB27_08370, partial [Planctomycetales bacterium]|nr:hypothetical protein [Planctomycetales bacterium]
KPAPDNRIDHRIRFDIEFSDGRREEVFVPELFEVAEFEEILIDDGQDVSRDRFGSRGTGNGDGLVNPGENVLVYTGRNRLRLFTDDPNVEWLEEEQLSELLPSVSGPDFRLTSVVKISPSAEPGTEIRFLANFETKRPISNPIKPEVHWGTVTLTVAVPEPSTSAMQLIVVAFVVARCRSRRCHA